MKDVKSFLGRGWSFPPEFNKVSGTVEMVEDEEDIRQSIIIFLSTAVQERTMRPNFGNQLKEHLFATVNADTINNIIEELKVGLRRYEPRIQVEKIEVDTDRLLDGEIRFSITYEIEATNVRDNIVYPYYFVEGTNI
jgi:phage baseplate assembly protein W